MVRALASVLVSFRLPLILAANICATLASFFLAIGLRFDFDYGAGLDRPYLIPLTLLLLFRTISYGYWRLNQGYWRYSSTADLIVLVKAHAVSTVLLTAGLTLIPNLQFPRSVIFMEFALSLLVCGGLRMVTRLAFERFFDRSSTSQTAGVEREVIVLGAGDSGHLLVKVLGSHRRLGYRPVAVLDDSERLLACSVFGAPVIGPISQLPEVLQKRPRIAAVIVAIPSYSTERFQAVEKICQQAGVPLKRVQSFEDIACLDAAQARDSISIESVLDREVKVEHEDEILAALHAKRVLITGAGGSIGSELVRQILQFSPAQVVLLDNSEFNLFKAGQEFSKIAPQTVKHFELASVCDEHRMLGIFKKYQPQFVYHAAAYKHVPLLENNCYEAFRNNIVGTRNLLSLSSALGVERFVLISTDKAVDPISVMGTSKRIAELLTQEACARTRSAANMGFTAAAVRFGNVINSAGSVIPLFKEQILSGGPLTVTHPDMERYFMSIREAVRLVLTAGTISDNGEVYILDMGKSIKIVDVAKKMRALYGRRDIPIVFTGIRPGEKLRESLNTIVEGRSSTRFRKVSRLVAERRDSVDVFQWVLELDRKLPSLGDKEIGDELRAFVSRVSGGSVVPNVAQQA